MFWIRRFVLVFGGALVVIVGAQLLKGHTITYAAMQGLLWAWISTTVFPCTCIFQSRQGRYCAFCRDTPEMRIGRPDDRA